MPKKLMHYSGPESEQMVWLVWVMKNDRPSIAVICTNDEVLSRYVSDDRKTRLGSLETVFVEKAITDHLFGSNDMKIAAGILRNSS